MSPYAAELASARLEAIRQLVTAMEATDDPAETRRCALAIFSAADPCDLDDEIELDDEADDEDEGDEDNDDGHGDTQEDNDPDASDDDTPIAPCPRIPVQPATTRALPSSFADHGDRPCASAPAYTAINNVPTLQSAPLLPLTLFPNPTTPAARLITAAGRSP